MLALVLPACSDPSSKTPDAAALDAARLDATIDGPASVCTGACRTLTAKATRVVTTVAFDRAFYGYNGPNAAPTSLRIELYTGGDATCPTMISASPPPIQGLIVSAIPVTSRTVPTSDVNAKVSYRGSLTQTPIVRSVAVSLSAITASFVANDLYVAFDISATLGEAINITGHVFAIHCASLDEMP